MASITERVNELLSQDRAEQEKSRLNLLDDEKSKQEFLRQKTELYVGFLMRSGADAMFKELNRNFLGNRGQIIYGYFEKGCFVDAEPSSWRNDGCPAQRQIHSHPTAWYGIAWKKGFFSSETREIGVNMGLSTTGKIFLWNHSNTHYTFSGQCHAQEWCFDRLPDNGPQQQFVNGETSIEEFLRTGSVELQRTLGQDISTRFVQLLKRD